MGSRFKDLSGQKIGKLLVIGIAPRHPSGRIQFYCKCDCGVSKIITAASLGKKKPTISCGCENNPRKYGHLKVGINSSEYHSWSSMKQRCYNKNEDHYYDYGGRGITICERWLSSFENFIEDMGLKPTPNYSIDRINNNGNYEPGNCRWATDLEQSNNRNFNLLFDIDGNKVNVREFLRQKNIKISRFNYLYYKKRMTLSEVYNLLSQLCQAG